VSVTGGSLIVTRSIQVGNFGDGTFTQNGGVVTNEQTHINRGSYTLFSGVFTSTVSTDVSGYGGAALFQQSGGTHNTPHLTIGDKDTVAATYDLSGGVLKTDLTAIANNYTARRLGCCTQRGGTHDVGHHWARARPRVTLGLTGPCWAQVACGARKLKVGDDGTGVFNPSARHGYGDGVQTRNHGRRVPAGPSLSGGQRHAYYLTVGERGDGS
jgi:hypothetical protein